MTSTPQKTRCDSTDNNILLQLVAVTETPLHQVLTSAVHEDDLGTYSESLSGSAPSIDTPTRPGAITTDQSTVDLNAEDRELLPCSLLDSLSVDVDDAVECNDSIGSSTSNPQSDTLSQMQTPKLHRKASSQSMMMSFSCALVSMVSDATSPFLSNESQDTTESSNEFRSPADAVHASVDVVDVATSPMQQISAGTPPDTTKHSVDMGTSPMPIADPLTMLPEPCVMSSNAATSPMPVPFVETINVCTSPATPLREVVVCNASTYTSPMPPMPLSNDLFEEEPVAEDRIHEEGTCEPTSEEVNEEVNEEEVVSVTTEAVDETMLLNVDAQGPTKEAEEYESVEESMSTTSTSVIMVEGSTPSVAAVDVVCGEPEEVDKSIRENAETRAEDDVAADESGSPAILDFTVHLGLPDESDSMISSISITNYEDLSKLVIEEDNRIHQEHTSSCVREDIGGDILCIGTENVVVSMEAASRNHEFCTAIEDSAVAEEDPSLFSLNAETQQINLVFLPEEAIAENLTALSTADVLSSVDNGMSVPAHEESDSRLLNSEDREVDHENQRLSVSLLDQSNLLHINASALLNESRDVCTSTDDLFNTLFPASAPQNDDVSPFETSLPSVSPAVLPASSPAASLSSSTSIGSTTRGSGVISLAQDEMAQINEVLDLLAELTQPSSVASASYQHYYQHFYQHSQSHSQHHSALVRSLSHSAANSASKSAVATSFIGEAVLPQQISPPHNVAISLQQEYTMSEESKIKSSSAEDAEDEHIDVDLLHSLTFPSPPSREMICSASMASTSDLSINLHTVTSGPKRSVLGIWSPDAASSTPQSAGAQRALTNANKNLSAHKKKSCAAESMAGSSTASTPAMAITMLGDPAYAIRRMSVTTSEFAESRLKRSDAVDCVETQDAVTNQADEEDMENAEDSNENALRNDKLDINSDADSLKKTNTSVHVAFSDILTPTTLASLHLSHSQSNSGSDVSHLSPLFDEDKVAEQIFERCSPSKIQRSEFPDASCASTTHTTPAVSLSVPGHPDVDVAITRDLEVPRSLSWIRSVLVFVVVCGAISWIALSSINHNHPSLQQTSRNAQQVSVYHDYPFFAFKHLQAKKQMASRSSSVSLSANSLHSKRLQRISMASPAYSPAEDIISQRLHRPSSLEESQRLQTDQHSHHATSDSLQSQTMTMYRAAKSPLRALVEVLTESVRGLLQRLVATVTLMPREHQRILFEM